jgi:hypothetical protein
MRFRLITLVLAATGSLVSTPAHTATVKVEPDAVWIERGRGQQFVAADFVFTNERPDTLELTYVEVSALDAGGRLLSRRFIGANGTAPSIQTIAKRQVLNRVPLLVFNPFPDWDAALPIATLRYRFELESVARAERRCSPRFARRAFEQKTKLMFPLAGRVFVFDAHDALAITVASAHIVRANREARSHPQLGALRIRPEPGRREGIDVADRREAQPRLVELGRSGCAHRRLDVSRRPTATCPDWEVGRTGLELDAIMADPTTLFGTLVVIDHGNGEFSMLAHMKQGSVLVKQGDVCAPGRTIGAVGYSGSVFSVHLHYELRTGVGLDVEGLPSRFEQVDRWIGGKARPQKKTASSRLGTSSRAGEPFSTEVAGMLLPIPSSETRMHALLVVVGLALALSADATNTPTIPPALARALDRRDPWALADTDAASSRRTRLDAAGCGRRGASRTGTRRTGSPLGLSPGGNSRTASVLLGERRPPDTDPSSSSTTTDCAVLNVVSAALSHAREAGGERRAMAIANYRDGHVALRVAFSTSTTDRLDSCPYYHDITVRVAVGRCRESTVTLNRKRDGSR